MLCQQCKKKEATIHMTKVVNNIKKERYLCRTCAAVLQDEQATSGQPWGSFFESLLPGPSLFGYPFTSAERRVVPRRLVCPQCGETERELRETGLLGCSRCYDVFHDLLIPVFRRAQGHTRHVQVTDVVPFHSVKKSGEGKESRHSIGRASSAKQVDEALDATSEVVPIDDQKKADDYNITENETKSVETMAETVTEDGSKRSQQEIEELRIELRNAVSREDYREAARLRDIIHEREKEASK